MCQSISSDTLLREAVEEPAYAVYHMQPAYAVDPNSNQVSTVSASAEIERALIHLVGDLANYSPRSKVVILEGSGESEIDVHLVGQLFPLFSERVNLISGGSKNGVKTLQVLLNKAAENGRLDARFYSIVDKDYDGPNLVNTDHQYSWDVYHIENYLLEPKFIHEVINRLKLGAEKYTEDEIENKLRKSAKETVELLVKIRLRRWVHDHLIGCINLGFNASEDLVDGFYNAAERSSNKMNNIFKEKLTKDKITGEKERIQQELIGALNNDKWKVVFRGRDILKRFVSGDIPGISYENFRNLIANQMREEGYQPPGMKKVIDSILNS